MHDSSDEREALYRDELEAEQQAVENVERLARELVAAAGRYVWQWGDGLGAAVYEAVTNAAREAGLPTTARELTSRSTGKRRAISPTIRAQVLIRDQLRCRRCGEDDPTKLVLDHVIPWSKGGPDTVENLQTLCRKCNAAKGARVE